MRFYKSITAVIIAIIVWSCEENTQYDPWMFVDSKSIAIGEFSPTHKIISDTLFNQLIKDNYLAAIQSVSKNELEVLYIIPSSSEVNSKFLKSIKKENLKSHNYSGETISELTIKANDRWVFAQLNQMLLLSKNSVLVENAIRTGKSENPNNFKSTNQNLFQFTLLKNDLGNLYINWDHFSEYSSSLSNLVNRVPILTQLKGNIVLDIKEDKGLAVMNGFTPGDSCLVNFQTQSPVHHTLFQYIPNSAEAFIHIGISDINKFQPLSKSHLKALGLSGEIATIKSYNSKMSMLFTLSASQSKLLTTSYQEDYSGYQILKVDSILIRKSLGAYFPIDSLKYGFIRNRCMMLSTGIDDLKSHIDAIESDDTWGKSLNFQKFNEHCLSESNLSIYLRNFNLKESLANQKIKYPELIDSLFGTYDWLSIQYSALDQHFYTSINLSESKTEIKNNPSGVNTSDAITQINVPSPITYANLVINHTSNTNEILLQDLTQSIALISLKDGVLWSKSFQEKIATKIEQVDYFKNGKLQYLLASNEKLHLIDRLGRDVKGFPHIMPAQIQFLSVVDYDNSKNYRYLVSTSNKNVYLLDKEGNNLSEWGPKSFTALVAYAPIHFRISGSDYFMIVTSDKNVHLFDRRGKLIRIMALEASAGFAGEYFLNKGTNLASTTVSFITNSGQLIQYGLDGKKFESVNLVRGQNSTYTLVRDLNRTDAFWIARIDTDKITLHDNKGQLVFERANASSGKMTLQVASLDNKRVVLSCFDPDLNLSYHYDINGNELTQPLNSTSLPMLKVNKAKETLQVYSVNSNVISLVEIPFIKK